MRTLSAGLLGGLAGAAGIALTATSGWLIVSAAARPVILTLLTAIVAVRTFGIARPALRYSERLLSHDTALTDLTRRRVALFGALIPLTPAGGPATARRPAHRARHRPRRRSGRAGQGRGAVDRDGGRGDARHCRVRGVVAACRDRGRGIGAPGGRRRNLDHLLERRSQSAVLEARAQASATATLIADNLLGLRAIGAERALASRLADHHRALRRAVARQSAGRSVDMGLTILLVAGANAVVVTAAVQATRSGVITAPVAALLTVTPIALGEVLTVIPDAVGALCRSQAARRRTRTLLAQEPAVAAAAGRSSAPVETATAGPASPAGAVPELRAAALTAGWSDGRTDLGQIDLLVAPGEHVVLCGPNGSGKSTLLAVLARQLDPSGGTYLLDGRDALELDLDTVRAWIAVLDDEPHVFGTSVRQNIRLARPESSDTDVRSALTAAGLEHWLDELPDGLDTALGSGGRGVSAASGKPEWTRSGAALSRPVAWTDQSRASRITRLRWRSWKP